MTSGTGRGRGSWPLHEINKTDEVWPEHWSAPIKLLNLKNVPNSLKPKKEELIKSGKDHDSRISIEEVSALFPKRDGPLPKSVLAARKRRAEARRRKQLEQEEDDNEGWDDVPVYIRAFAEFERMKRLERKNARLSSEIESSSTYLVLSLHFEACFFLILQNEFLFHSHSRFLTSCTGLIRVRMCSKAWSYLLGSF